MILTTLTSHDVNPAPAGELAPDDRVQVGLQTPNQISCRVEIDRVINDIDAPAVKEIVDTVFSDLLRLLECLSLIERHLRQEDIAEENLGLFQIIHDEACVLVEFIRADALACVAMDEELKDTLDGITFAVNHDLQRVFDTGQPNPSGEKTTHVMLGRLYRAHDLLTNCLQQSTITLAMMFDSELVGAKLFNNSDMRYRQSLQLCEDLTALLQLIQASEANVDEPALDPLYAGVEKFRNESLECLMYSDWPQFESFCERIKVAGTSAVQLEPVLHQFRCYLETLLGQVRMRAVLANVFPMQFGADQSFATPMAAVEQSTQVSSSSDHNQADEPWDEFAVAV
jgi:hypothetical protein